VEVPVYTWAESSTFAVPTLVDAPDSDEASEKRYVTDCV